MGKGFSGGNLFVVFSSGVQWILLKQEAQITACVFLGTGCFLGTVLGFRALFTKHNLAFMGAILPIKWLHVHMPFQIRLGLHAPTSYMVVGWDKSIAPQQVISNLWVNGRLWTCDVYGLALLLWQHLLSCSQMCFVSNG